jgi:hypothetical protein
MGMTGRSDGRFAKQQREAAERQRNQQPLPRRRFWEHGLLLQPPATSD